MRRLPLLCALAVTACASSGNDIAPGGVIHDSQLRAKVETAPAGSLVNRQTRGPDGRLTFETYAVQPDRSLQLIRRQPPLGPPPAYALPPYPGQPLYPGQQRFP